MKDKWTWPEIILTAILLPPAFIGVMVLLGTILDTAAQHSEQHDRCMKRATNGYEIERCR